MKWWWSKPAEHSNGLPAEQAAIKAKHKLIEQQNRWPEVHRAADRFALLVEHAMRGQSP